VTARRV